VEAFAVVFDKGETRLGLMVIDACAVDDYLFVPVRQAAAGLGIAPSTMMAAPRTRTVDRMPAISAASVATSTIATSMGCAASWHWHRPKRWPTGVSD
jgi:hypothetical protein